MGLRTVLVDTSILIDYFRKQNKERTTLFKLSQKYSLAVSVITKLEIFVGVKDSEQQVFWNAFFDRIIVYPVDELVIDVAVDIYKSLKSLNKLIAIPDLLIAATAICHSLPLATINLKHFQRVEGLEIVGEL